jgi:hypothetical protein
MTLADFMDHVTFWMPALVLLVSVDFHELLQDRVRTSNALGGEASRVVEMTVYDRMTER